MFVCYQTNAMQIFTLDDVNSWERFYRANFINSLTGFKPVSLIGTANTSGQPNLAVFSSIVHIGSNPPLVGYINRPLSAAPHTIKNIETTGEYTINHINESFIQQAHQTSAKYPEHINEFEAVGLNAEFTEYSKAPFVKESQVKYALTLEEIVPIKLNDTFLVIGKINAILLDNDIISADGFIELDKAGTVCSNGTDGYYKTALINRYAYAKPDAAAFIVK